MSKTDQQDAHRYEALKRSLADLGMFRRGSVVRRFMPCGKPGCRCQAAPPNLHGPYYQWTRKVGGKTATLRLSEREAKLLKDMASKWPAPGHPHRANGRSLPAPNRSFTQKTTQLVSP